MSEQIIDACARAAHEANRAYCMALGDTSQPSWDTAPQWQRESVKAGVRGALAGNTPEQSHEGWLALKKADGWIWGPVKDPAKKEHPCMVPYDKLPPEQKAKDALFRTIVVSVAIALRWIAQQGVEPKVAKRATIFGGAIELRDYDHLRLTVEHEIRLPHDTFPDQDALHLTRLPAGTVLKMLHRDNTGVVQEGGSSAPGKSSPS